MTNAARRRAILFLILTVLVTVLLAAALPQFELQKGVPLPWGKGQAAGEAQQGTGQALSINARTFLASILVLFFVATTIYLITMRRQRLSRKEILQTLASIAMSAAILATLLYAFSNVKIDMAPSAVEILPVEIPAVIGPPLAPVPTSLLWLVWVGLGGLVLLLVMGMARVHIRPRVVQDPLAQEAEQAVEALKAGQEFSNVIIRCYEQMSLILKKEQHLTLEAAMTAREFEALLERRGVPNPPVRELTRLFEIARYASRPPGPGEEAQAVECLQAIARYSGKKTGQAK